VFRVDGPAQSEPAPTVGPEAASRALTRRDTLGRLALLVLPVSLALVAYYPGVLRGGPWPQPNADGDFYVYQLARAGETGGQWWRAARDNRVGWPYPTEVARHAGLYEGVDLLLLAAGLAHGLEPVPLYHLAVLAALAVNGWVAAWVVYRGTGSYLWAAVSAALITLSSVTGGRVNCHLHLLKYGWPLLTVWAFSRYLDAPTWRRGAVLGLAAAWALQGSFYLGYLLMLGLAAWWLGCLVAGRLRRAHLAAAAAAGAAFAPASALLLFPVWASARRALGSEDYFQRTRFDTWHYASELWQYAVPKWSADAQAYTNVMKHAKDASGFGEGWNYLGMTVLLGVAAYLVARARGVRFRVADPRLLDRLVGLLGVFVVLSLADGPSFFLYKYFGTFRVYGRAGMLATALGCVAAPLALCGLVRGLSSRTLRAAAVACVVALTAVDGYQANRIFAWWGDVPEPEWAVWLARQPRSVRLAAFPPRQPGPFGWWGVTSLVARVGHGHATLNGGQFQLLEADLRLLGASYDRLNPDAVRFVASLGYETLAFHQDYLAANAWLETFPWLEPVERVGPWRVFRYAGAAPRFPALSVEQLLARAAKSPDVLRVPPRAWVTGRLDLPETVVLAERSQGRLTWLDADGRAVDGPVPGLFGHVYGPGLPAYTVKTPKEPGRYRLVYDDDRGHKSTLSTYEVDPHVTTSRRAAGGKLPDVRVGRVQWETRGDRAAPARVAVENAGPFYLQAETQRDRVSTSAHPGVTPASAGALILHVEAYRRAEPLPFRECDLTLPGDLPPGGRLTLDLPAAWYDGVAEPVRVLVTPLFAGLGTRLADGPDAPLRFGAVDTTVR
jgi:hypothetical protein